MINDNKERNDYSADVLLINEGAGLLVCRTVCLSIFLSVCLSIILCLSVRLCVRINNINKSIHPLTFLPELLHHSC